MRTVGIICECNPFHGGHEYLIGRAKESGADAVICVMSGYFVQRGEAAIAPAHLRAEALLEGGADAVLELPFPFCSSGAEFFASAGVEILDRLGVGELWFGSECGEITRLDRLSALADTEAFRADYSAATRGNGGTAKEYLDRLCALAGDGEPLSSNDILGIAYLRALRARDSSMRAVTVKREGSAYRDGEITAGKYPSATALRRIWREEGLEAMLTRLPEQTREIYRREHPPLADLALAELLILGHLRLTSPEALEAIAELGGGLGNRLAECAREARTFDELLSLAATKKYPNARVRRGILFALTGIRDGDLRASPAYVRLLAANAKGRQFLAETRREQTIPVVTRRTDLPSRAEAERQAEWERRAFALYSLCLPTPCSETSLWTRGVVIKK
ncbi:MAG: nucleotidyltransferase family protein [Clostridia bacterium]|nr:nucleotidyltransferase family protein [Clostridia bacterium]